MFIIIYKLCCSYNYFVANTELLLYFSYRFKTKNYFKPQLSINIYYFNENTILFLYNYNVIYY